MGPVRDVPRFDRRFFSTILSYLNKSGWASPEQASKLSHELFEVDELAEQLIVILRDKLKPAAQERNDKAFLEALVMYDIRLWELQDQHLRRARRIIDSVSRRLSNAIEREEGSQRLVQEPPKEYSKKKRAKIRVPRKKLR